MTDQADALGWLAAAGWGYGILSDVLGEMRSVPVNSVVRLLSLLLAKVLNLPISWRLDRRHVVPPSAVNPSDYGSLMAAGWRLRTALLRDPLVRRVEVGIMGEHLVLTVYKEAPKASGYAVSNNHKG